MSESLNTPNLAILEAFAKNIREELQRGLVEIERDRGVSEEQAELPLINVCLGAEDPAKGSTMDELAALLNIRVFITDLAPTKLEVVKQISKIRSQLHRVLMPENVLGLPFKHSVGWLGATERQFDVSGVGAASEVETRWQVYYRFPRDNPDAALEIEA